MAFDPLAPCSTQDENAFGPAVSSNCLMGFDFTLLFEESILTLLPLGIALLLAFPRIYQLSQRRVKTRLAWLFAAKCIFYLAYIVLHIALLALWVVTDVPKTTATLATASLTFLGFMVLLVLSYYEHAHSVRPSTLLDVYLGLSCLLDLARTRTLFFLPQSYPIASVFLAAFCVKVVILLLETVEKRHLLLRDCKDASPEDVSGIFNRSLFLWVNRLFISGFNNILTVDMLTPLDKEILDASQPDDLIDSWNAASKSSEHALLFTFAWHYMTAISAGVYPRLAYIGFTFAQPFLVQRVLDFIDQPVGPNTNNYAYGLVGAYALVYIGIAVSYAWYEHKTYRVLTIFRGSLITLIFKKTLRISTTAVSDAEAVTLMSADIDRIGLGLREIHEWWAAFIELALSLWLLERLLGVSMAASTVWIILCLLVGMPVAVAAGNAQTPWLEAIEKRLAVTSSMLGAMTGIKITGLAASVSTKIRNLRKKEIKASLWYRFYTVFVISISYASSGLAPVFGFGLFILLANAHGTETLTSSVAFAALTLYSLQDRPLVSLVDGFSEIQIVINSFRRIQQHLLSVEREDCRQLPSHASSMSASASDEELEKRADSEKGLLAKSNLVAMLSDASAGYSGKENIFEGLDLKLGRGKTTMIAGPVGSGKSTLLKLLLGEIPHSSGIVSTAFSQAAYCSQSPWITFGTIQQNILGMTLWDKPWYATVIKACNLTADFEDLPDGDQTKVGTRGSRLSGGQQIRVAFARALYSRQPVLILDDVLTGLDKVTERNILDMVFAPDGLVKKAQLTVILATNSASHLRYSDEVVILNEDHCVAQQGAYQDLLAEGGYLHRLAAEPNVSTIRKQELDISEDTLDEIGLGKVQEEEADMDPSRKTGDLTVYRYYFSTAGWSEMITYLFACCVFVFGVSFPTVWLELWTNANDAEGTQRVGYWLGIYGALGVLQVLSVLGSNWLFMMWIVPKTARKFHEYLLTTTMHATTSFLTSTDHGKTTNRFSQDLELIDNDLPSAFEITIISILQAIAEAVLVFIGSGYVSAAIPACLVLIWVIQKYYLRTSRQLRLLDIEAKAPLFSQFLETLSGVASIRAFGWSDAYLDRNYTVLNHSQRPYYLLWCIQRWLTFVLDMFVACLAILLVGIVTNVHNGSTAFLGVALFNIVSFGGTLQELVTEWVELETAIGAVSRIRSYVRTTKSEDLDGEDQDPPAEWPTHGRIEYKEVAASYESSPEPVLKEVSVTIAPGEKVALCGRTGSGKSSFVSTLLRMLELDAGSILIDGVNIASMPRQSIRDALNTLPQAPFFLHGSVRLNLDPRAEDGQEAGAGDESDDESDSDDDEDELAAKRQRRKEKQVTEEAHPTPRDRELIETLESVGLWSQTQARGGLSAKLDSEALSHGQRQLFCLARAVLAARTCPIFIMDEATANVDAETDQLMQQVIRERFHGKTMLAIAHKLDTIMDFDKVIVLEKGRIVEIGPPRELKERHGGVFREMVRAVHGDGYVDLEEVIDEGAERREIERRAQAELAEPRGVHDHDQTT